MVSLVLSKMPEEVGTPVCMTGGDVVGNSVK